METTSVDGLASRVGCFSQMFEATHTWRNFAKQIPFIYKTTTAKKSTTVTHIRNCFTAGNTPLVGVPTQHTANATNCQMEGLLLLGNCMNCAPSRCSLFPGKAILQHHCVKRTKELSESFFPGANTITSQ